MHELDGISDNSTSDEEKFGLPQPKKYEGECFNVFDYISYSPEAKSLEEAIEMRGYEAFIGSVEPGDFSAGFDNNAEKLGIAELWFQSTWHEGTSQRDLRLEQTVASIKEGDMLEMCPCSKETSEWGYLFKDSCGNNLPFQPYHDFDDIFFRKTIASVIAKAIVAGKPVERIRCRVRGCDCFGEDGGVPVDPTFNWRVYSCKVTVYKTSND